MKRGASAPPLFWGKQTRILPKVKTSHSVPRPKANIYNAFSSMLVLQINSLSQRILKIVHASPVHRETHHEIEIRPVRRSISAGFRADLAEFPRPCGAV
jgi:hypothetical protein